MDAYFSADVETDGAIPGPFSMLSFALVYAGTFDGSIFRREGKLNKCFYRELKPISENFEQEALDINRLDREKLKVFGDYPSDAMDAANAWIEEISKGASPVLVAYPLSFDWSWLYWYFIRFSTKGSPFAYSRCFDVKTAFAVKAGIPVSEAGRSQIPKQLLSRRSHNHNALDDAKEQAEIFSNIFEWKGKPYDGNW